MQRIIRTNGLALVAVLAGAGCAIDPTEPDGAQARTELALVKPGTPRHCVQNVESGAPPSCFATFTEAFAHLSAGRIADAPVDPHAAFADAAFMARVAALPPPTAEQATNLDPVYVNAGLPLATEFEDAGWGGSSMTLGSFHGCNGNGGPTPIAGLAVMPSGWNDEISSFQTFPRCWQILYADGGYRGRSTAKSQSMIYVGDAMNDQASTILFF